MKMAIQCGPDRPTATYILAGSGDLKPTRVSTLRTVFSSVAEGGAVSQIPDITIPAG